MSHPSSKWRNERAFTLTELFVTLLFIAILALILLPGVVLRPNRENARVATCLSNQKQIALGFLQYAQDYDSHLPGQSNWRDALYPYVKNQDVMGCPSGHNDRHLYVFNPTLSRRKTTDFDASVASRLYLTMDGKDKGTQPDIERHRSENGSVIAFLDGHAKYELADAIATGKGLMKPETASAK